MYLRYSSETPTFYQSLLASRNTADVTGGKPIAVLLQYISGGSAIIPLVAFYDIHEGKHSPCTFLLVCYVHHHQPINVPAAEVQAFLMDYTQGERAISHHAGPVRVATLELMYFYGADDARYSNARSHRCRLPYNRL
jgi:hypothetical protein